MRIANDLMMFTKCGQEMTCVFLSRSFHELEKIDEVLFVWVNQLCIVDTHCINIFGFISESFLNLWGISIIITILRAMVMVLIVLGSITITIS